eukprot:TRINITY_DN616_c0_g1_i12.p1 TRINITY_DN616_c0_g1~~TRINITY_DN616_c0_g1_i12.p1  ORF type:complete len:165 (+),score=51.01 TRINITY_DN616_c0_g1_i12:801-1295(+)
MEKIILSKSREPENIVKRWVSKVPIASNTTSDRRLVQIDKLIQPRPHRLGLGAAPDALSDKHKTSLETKAQKRSLGRGGGRRKAGGGRSGSDDDGGSGDDGSNEEGSLSKGMTPTSGKVISAGTKRVRERVHSEMMNLEKLQDERKKRKKAKQRKKRGMIDPDE